VFVEIQWDVGLHLLQPAVVPAHRALGFRHEPLDPAPQLPDGFVGLAPLLEQRPQATDVGVVLLLQSRQCAVAATGIRQALLQVDGLQVIRASLLWHSRAAN